MKILIFLCLTALTLTGLIAISTGEPVPEPKAEIAAENAIDLPKTEAEWKEKLTAEEFRILRKQGTERAYSGTYWDHKEKGIYLCVGCDNPLFSSETKYDSKTGWPSFWEPVSETAIETREDRRLWSVRTEVICTTCKGHLGHVFEDGPKPTGLRYCINSIPLKFQAADTDTK